MTSLPVLFSIVSKSFLKKLAIVISLIIININYSYGQGKNFTISRKDPSWIVSVKPSGDLPKAKDISDGYFLSFNENQHHVELQEQYYHRIRNIVSEAGVQNGSQISVTYQPDYQKLIFNKIIVWRNNQPSDRLVAANFKILQSEKDLSRFIYNGTFDAFMVLDDIRKGDRIEYAFTIKGNNPAFGEKFASEVYVEGPSSIGHFYTNIICNKQRALKFKNFNNAKLPVIKENGNYKIYEWENKLTKTYRVEDFEPSWYNPLKHTQVSEYKNWNEVVNWGLAINDYPNLASPLLDKKAAELKSLSKNNKEKYIQLATRFVQDEIRYMGIELGEYSHKPNSPEKVLKQRYGDCKDKSLLLVHLLKAIDVKAYLAYINTDDGYTLKEYLPSPFAFDHVVVVIDYDQQKIWIDPTISNQGGIFKNIFFPDYGNALVLKKGVNSLENVISIPTGKLISELVFEIGDTVGSKPTSLMVTSIYNDNYADDIRNEIASDGPEDLERSFLEYFAKMYPDIETRESLKIKDDPDLNTIEIIESYSIPNIWNKNEDSDQFYAAFHADLITSELRDAGTRKRTSPFLLKYPVSVEQNIIVHLPELWNLKNESFKSETDYHYFESYRSAKGKIMKLNYVYRTLKHQITSDEVKSYRKDLAKIQENLGYNITWNVGIPGGNANSLLILLSILTLLIAGLLFLRIYIRQEEFDLQEILAAKSINGWLAVIAVYIVFYPLRIFFIPIVSGIYDQGLWDNMKDLDASSEYALKTLYIIEAIGSGILFCYSIYLMVMFFNRRKGFKSIYLKFLILINVLLIINFLIIVTSKYAFGIDADISSSATSLAVSFLISGLIGAYFLKSERVKEVFVFTYPETAWNKARIMHYRDQMKKSKDISDSVRAVPEKDDMNLIKDDENI